MHWYDACELENVDHAHHGPDHYKSSVTVASVKTFSWKEQDWNDSYFESFYSINTTALWNQFS